VVAPADATSRTQVAQTVAQRLASIAARVIGERWSSSASGTRHEPRSSERSGGDTDDLVATLTARFSSEAMPDLLELLGDLDRVDRGRALLSGDLSVVPIGAILQLLQAENQTGILVCTSPASSLIRTGDAASGPEVRATFRDGVIDLVQSTGAGDEFRLGRFFVEAGIVSPEEIELVAERQRAEPVADPPEAGGAPLRGIAGAGPPDTSLMGETEEHEAIVTHALGDTRAGTAWGHEAAASPKPLGMALLAAGRIVESQLRAALTRQSSELLYEVIRWPTGRFELRREPPGELAMSARLGLPVAAVVMEGFRRVDEWRAIEHALGSFDAVVVRDDAALGGIAVDSLPPKERAVLDVVDGVRSVRAIVAASHRSSFDVCRILAQFLEARVLRRRMR
jgi:hypothetical protein